MAGAVEVIARGAVEAGERGGGQPQADLAGAQGVVWDHVAFHKAKAVGEGGCGGYINRPTLLNPAERVLEEVRWWIEGRIYGSMEAKLAAVESF